MNNKLQEGIRSNTQHHRVGPPYQGECIDLSSSGKFAWPDVTLNSNATNSSPTTFFSRDEVIPISISKQEEFLCSQKPEDILQWSHPGPQCPFVTTFVTF